MLLNSSFHQASAYDSHQLPYNTVESLLDDVSKQISTSGLSRRQSRGAGGQRINGGSMRIAKPSSTSNSPRGSSSISRRKTLMSGGSYGRPVMMDQLTNSSSASRDGLQVPARSSRPVSWHPTTHMAQQFQYPVSNLSPNNNLYGGYEMPMTPAIYSGYTSPASTFSPLSLPYTQYDHYPFPDETTSFPSLDQNNNIYAPYQPSALRQHEFTPQQPQNNYMEDPSMYTHFDWNNFAINGFSTTTAPPTPDNLLPIQRPDGSTFEVEGAITYQPLDENEDDGEELIGMGLYDTPDKATLCDPQLETYRTAMMHQSLDYGCRKVEVPFQPAGKGLKLEETWVPPPPEEEDEEDDEDDDEIDAHGEAVEEETTTIDADESILAKFAGIGHCNSNSWRNMI